MISSNPMRVALTAAVFGCAVAAAQADECDTMTKTVEVMIDKPRPAITLPACAPLMARASD